MTGIDRLLHQPLMEAVGWALVHFLWQGALVGSLTALALLALRRGAADIRYVVAVIGLALMVTMPAVTATQNYRAHRSAAADGAAGGSVAAATLAGLKTRPTGGEGLERMKTRATDASAATAASTGLPSNMRRILPWLLLAWLAGVTLLTLRLFSSWIWIQRLRRHGAPPRDPGWHQMTIRLAKRLHITRTIGVLESALVDVPAVIGWLRPVVLLPASALAGLAPHQLEAILAHELAHIRRHDYLVNLLQTLVETLLFYHPAVWWLSRRIRQERENCCDDLAVRLCGDAIAYAAALADLDALRSNDLSPAFRRVGGVAMAADGGSLLHRVRRLLGAPASHAGRGPAWLAASVAILLLAGLGIGAGAAQDPSSSQVRAEALTHTGPVEVRAEALTPTGPVELKAEALTPTGPVEVALTHTGPGGDQAKPDRPAVAGSARPDQTAPPAPAVAGAAAQDLPASPPVRPRPATPPATVDVSADAMSAALAQSQQKLAHAAEAMEAARQANQADAAAIAARTTAAVHAAEAKLAWQSVSLSHDKSSGTWVWSDNGEKLAVKYRGEVDFTDDDADVSRMSPGGSLQISDGAWLGRHTVEIREDQGRLERRYWVNGSERPYEPEGREWLGANLPKFVRNTGIDADRRVARFLKSGGPAAVLAEIGRIDSSYVKRIYFSELFNQASLDADTYARALAHVGREIDSDYERATLLISIAGRIPQDEASRAAYFQAASGISSDYELRRVYATMLKRGPVSGAVLAGILQNAATIDSDYEQSQLLQQVVGLQPLDAASRPLFFKAAASVGSDYERHRVLRAAVTREDADAATVAAALRAAGDIGSDYEAASFLSEVLERNGLTAETRAAFFDMVTGLSSGYERQRVLTAVATRAGARHDDLLAVLRAAKGISGGYALAQVLLAVAQAQPITGDLRDAYLDAAGNLSGYEEGRVMTALVRSERR